MILISCNNYRDNEDIQSKIHNIIDSSTYLSIYSKNFYLIRHQKKQNRDYIEISTAKYFNKDSVFAVENYKNDLIIYYSKNYFKNKIEKAETLPAKYNFLEYSNNSVPMYHTRSQILEVLKNNKIRNVTVKESIEDSILNYGDQYIPLIYPKKN